MSAIINAPQINANDDQVGVVGWHVADGDYVSVGDDLVDLETSKATVTIAAEQDGYVRHLVAKGAIVNVGAPLCRIAASADEAMADAAPPPPPLRRSRTTPQPESATLTTPSPRVDAPTLGAVETRFSRDALEMIETLGLDRGAFEGQGLVTARSIRAAQSPAKPARAASASTVTHTVALQPMPATGRDEPLPLSKRAEIEALSTGESGTINSTLSVYFDSAAIRARLARDSAFDGAVQPIILYETARLLRQWPQLTAYYGDEAIHFYDRVDLGLALDLGRGLKVVTIRDADTLMPVELFERMIGFGLAYGDNKIAPTDLVGSTFTVTDLSGLDVLHFKPLINGRQSAILGIGGDGTQPSHPMSLNLTFDHRVANGREGAMFLRELRTRLTSYAIGTAQVTVPNAAPDRPQPLLSGGDVACGRCGIGLQSYREVAGADAYMFACFTENGTVEPYCHRCAGGFF